MLHQLVDGDEHALQHQSFSSGEQRDKRTLQFHFSRGLGQRRQGGEALEDGQALDEHLRAELDVLLCEMLLLQLAEQVDQFAHPSRLDKEGVVCFVTHEDAHALQHPEPMVPRLDAITVGLREEALSHEQPKHTAEGVCGIAVAEVVPLRVLQQEFIHLLLLMLCQPLVERLVQEARET